MSGASPVSVPAARCVLWHPCGSPPPVDLLDALQRRGLAWTATDRVLTAIVQTLAPPTSSAPLPIPSVLVFIDPPRLRALDEVLDVVARYRPRTALWVFDFSDPSRLKSMQALEIIAKFVPHKSEDRAESPRSTPSLAPEPDPGVPGWRLQLTVPHGKPDAPTSGPRVAPVPPVTTSNPSCSNAALTQQELATKPMQSPSQESGFRSVIM